MPDLVESQLEKRLSELNNTQQSVQTLSLWIIHHRRKSKQIVDVIFREIKRVRSPRQLINILYLCNDIIQTSRKKGPEYHRDFVGVLVHAFAHIARMGDEKVVVSLRKIMDVWQMRGVYDSSKMERLAYSITSNLTRKQLEIWSATGKASKEKKKSKGKPKPEQASTSSMEVKEAVLSTTPPLDGGPMDTGASGDYPFPLRLSPRAQSPESDIDASTDNPPPPDTEELIRAVHELDNAPSTDAAVREEIAGLPPEVADASKLDQIQTRDSANGLSQVVDHAHLLLTGYNNRLKVELEQRERTLKKLRSYIAAQNEKVEQDALILEQWKDKLTKLDFDRNDLKDHVNSLPDLNQLAAPLTAPLPSLGDLFTQRESS